MCMIIWMLIIVTVKRASTCLCTPTECIWWGMIGYDYVYLRIVFMIMWMIIYHMFISVLPRSTNMDMKDIDVYTYTCIHIHIYTYKYKYSFIYIYVYIHTYIYKFIYMHTCMYILMYVNMYTLCHTYIEFGHRLEEALIVQSVYIYIYIHVYTYIYI
jgi:hypothetical protein